MTEWSMYVSLLNYMDNGVLKDGRRSGLLMQSKTPFFSLNRKSAVNV